MIMLENQIPNPIQITTAQLTDVPELAQLDLRCNPHAWSEQAFQSAILSENDGVWLAKSVENGRIGQDGQIVGFLVYQYIQGLDEMELHLIATAPEFRKRGIAQFLINQLIDFAKNNQIERIFLEVRASNIPAQSLYQKNQFIQIGMRKNYYSNPTEHAILMEWKQD